MTRDTTTDVGALLDEGGWSGYQKLLVAATALTIIFDGLDNQLLGAAIPSMMREWSLPRPAFAAVLAAALFGMMIGGFIGGYVGDRIGRRLALLGSVIWFGVLTVLMSFAGDVTTLTALRFAAGLGLGGAMPNAAALASEYVPLRRRPFAVTLTVVCIPLGGTLAGFTGAVILPAYGWRWLFFVGGALPLVLAAAAVEGAPGVATVSRPRSFALAGARSAPAAPRTRPAGGRGIRRFARTRRRARLGRVALRSRVPPRHAGARRGVLFLPAIRVHGVNWVPSLLTSAGFDVAIANYGLMAFNLGGVVGAIGGAIVFARLGSRTTMLTMTAGAIGGCLLLANVPVADQSTVAVLAMLAWTGGLINAVQSTMYALAAHVYPAGIRATGVGTAVAIGRVGGIGSSYAGAWALESGPSQMFALIAGTLTFVFAALASVRNHIPSNLAVRAARAIAPAER